MALISTSVQLFQTLMRTIGYRAVASLFLGTAGRQLLQVALGSYQHLIPANIGQDMIDHALDVLAPPPLVVLTSTAKRLASGVVSDLATQGVHLILHGVLSGAQSVLVHLKDVALVGRIIRFSENIFSTPTQSACFLALETVKDLDVAKQINIIDEYAGQVNKSDTRTHYKSSPMKKNTSSSKSQIWSQKNTYDYVTL